MSSSPAIKEIKKIINSLTKENKPETSDCERKRKWAIEDGIFKLFNDKFIVTLRSLFECQIEREITKL